jgi:hypothetical protein
MESRFNILAKSILDKPLSECDEEELKKIAEQYPYFAPAHFLLLAKMDKDSESYSPQYQKSLLYYHDPLSFGHFLYEPDELIQEPEEVKQIPEVTDDNVADNLNPSDNQKPLSAALPLEISSDSSDLPLTFEPFHTVDYFASQGIKPTVDDRPDDKLGKQLKSFTEWLKTMKRIPPTQLRSMVEPAVEHKVEDMAAHSVLDAEILTEAMAEVWVKQGNKEKAKDTYQKLSLLHPAKSAYFAAKIQNLNE